MLRIVFSVHFLLSHTKALHNVYDTCSTGHLLNRNYIVNLNVLSPDIKQMSMIVLFQNIIMLLKIRIKLTKPVRIGFAFVSYITKPLIRCMSQRKAI